MMTTTTSLLVHTLPVSTGTTIFIFFVQDFTHEYNKLVEMIIIINIFYDYFNERIVYSFKSILEWHCQLYVTYIQYQDESKYRYHNP